MIETSRDPTRNPLDVVAEKILAFWKRADDQRVFAAMLLKEAKERALCQLSRMVSEAFAWAQ